MKILNPAILLRLGDLRYPSVLLLRTDRLYRSFPLCQYAGSGKRFSDFCRQVNNHQSPDCRMSIPEYCTYGMGIEHYNNSFNFTQELNACRKIDLTAD